MKKILLIAALMVTFGGAKAQEIHGNNDIWLFNLTQYKLNEKWLLGNEIHLRYDDYFNQSQQFLIRPYFDYSFSKKLIGSFGYTYILTRPYGDFPIATDKPEHNIWEQIIVKNQLGNWKLAHRFRLENRWSGIIETNPSTGEAEVNDYGFSNRFRYRLTLKRNLGEKFYTHLFNELWIKESNKFKTVSFDRNWIYAGLGWKTSSVVELELAYMHQYIQNNPTRYERHHTLLATLKLNLNY